MRAEIWRLAAHVFLCVALHAYLCSMCGRRVSEGRRIGLVVVLEESVVWLKTVLLRESFAELQLQQDL